MVSAVNKLLIFVNRLFINRVIPLFYSDIQDVDKKEIMELKPCPCCRSKAVFSALTVGKVNRRIKMWQASCRGCGLFTDLDESKRYAAKRWNLRQESAHLQMWITLLAAALPAAIVISLLLGNLLGLSISR